MAIHKKYPEFQDRLAYKHFNNSVTFILCIHDQQDRVAQESITKVPN